MKVFPYRLYLVISQESCAGKDWLEVLERAVLGGVDIVQLREKTLPTKAYIAHALRAKEILARYDVPLIINDNLEVAVAAQASGIHVGNSDMPPSLIRAQWGACGCLGYSIEYMAQLTTPETRAADYLGVSPVFPTLTKQDTVTAWGIEGIAQIRERTEKPLVAIGGMHGWNVGEAIRAGADCIAVVSAICQATNPQQASFDLRNQIEKAK